MTIFKSLSKIIAGIVILTASIAFIAVVFNNIQAEQVVIAVVAMYSATVASVTTYYFVKNKPQDTTI
jgi:hypothetical protein